MEQQGLSHVIVYGDREHFASTRFLTGYDPRFEESLVIVGLTGQPLLVGLGLVLRCYCPWCRSRTLRQIQSQGSLNVVAALRPSWRVSSQLKQQKSESQELSITRRTVDRDAIVSDVPYYIVDLLAAPQVGQDS